MRPQGAGIVVFCGLPGVGKTTLSRAVAAELGATWLRVDTIEATVARSLAPIGESPQGYAVAEAVAAEQLRLARPVVIDAVNAVAIARRGWRTLAERERARLWFVEVVCSDGAAHRARVEGRISDVPGLSLPSWPHVQNRRWEAFEPDLRVDNRGEPAVHVAEIVAWLRDHGAEGTGS